MSLCCAVCSQILVAPVEWLIVLTIMTLVDQRLYGHVLVDAQQVGLGCWVGLLFALVSPLWCTDARILLACVQPVLVA
jgi:hypothetical protein